jgi:mRNA interferase RelE/StbE
MARLPARVATAVLTYVDERLAENPKRLSKELSGDLLGLRSSRNGDHRILFRLTEDTLWVLRVAHRAQAYRHR